ncbi:Uncharacterized protein QTN25_001060 [Entamoeba marina]
MKTTLKGDVNGKEIVYTASIKEITNGMLIGQLDGSRQLKLAEANNDKEKAIKLSLKYNILSRFTAFIAIDTSKKLPIDDIKTVKLTGRSFYAEAQLASSYNSIGLDAIESNIDMMLDRCESIDELCDKSVDLSEQAQTFYKASRSLNKKSAIGGLFSYIGSWFSSTNNESTSSQVDTRNEEIIEETKEEKKDTTKIQEDDKGINYEKLIELQRADGHFINVLTVFKDYKEIQEKYQNIEENIFNTIVAICLLKTHFKDKKLQWDLLVKKAMGYLNKNKVDLSILDDVSSLIH